MGRKHIIAAALAVALLAPLADAQRGRGGGGKSREPAQESGEQRRGSGEQRRESGGRQDYGRGPRKGKHAGDWLRKFSQLPADQQERALSGDPEFQKLPAPAQQRLRDRLRWFNSLPPDRQNKILNRMDRFGHMTPEQQAQARQLFERQRALPPERHRMLRREFNRLEPMSAAARRREMEADVFRNTFTEQERNLLDDMLRLADEVEQTNQAE